MMQFGIATLCCTPHNSLLYSPLDAYILLLSHFVLCSTSLWARGVIWALTGLCKQTLTWPVPATLHLRICGHQLFPGHTERSRDASSTLEMRPMLPGKRGKRRGMAVVRPMPRLATQAVLNLLRKMYALCSDSLVWSGASHTGCCILTLAASMPLRSRSLGELERCSSAGTYGGWPGGAGAPGLLP